MNLKSFGCSFIAGTDLADDGRGDLRAKHSQLTWPSLYAQQLGYGYHCYARPGSGNLQIAERALSQIACNEYALYVIAWSWIDRFDYIPAEPQIHFWETIMPVDTTSLAKTYYRDLHSQYRDKLTTLINVRVVIDTLKQKGFPFIMTYMDDLMFEQEWHATPAITDLQGYIKPYMTRFENMNFLDWSKKYGYPISATMHPLEPAHAAAARYISELGVYKV